MKKILNIILIYVFTCVLGTAVLATLFMFNTAMLSHVADVPSALFSLDSFLCGLAISFPLAGAAALFAVVLSMVKKRKNQIFSLVLYLVLGVLTWIVLIPLSLSFFSDFQSKNAGQALSKKTTSTGIFREDANGVFYNSRILDDGNTEGIYIDKTGYFGAEGNISSFFDSPVNNDAAYPYSDILVKDALEPPKYVTYPLSIYTSLLTAAENSYGKGTLGWIFFASFGLVLLATYGLQFLSSWRLCSALSVAIGQILIVFINYFYYMGYFPNGLKQVDSAISKIIPTENSLIVAINILITILLLFFGLAMGVYRTKKAKNGEIQ